MSLMETIRSLFQSRQHAEISQHVQRVREQSNEMRERLSDFADSEDPFTDFVRAMREAAIKQRRGNGNGHR